jgi:hypothetical protein
MDAQIKRFIDKFVKELEEENVAIFAGAGLSVAAGYVDWKNLLAPIAEDIGLDIEKENDLVSLAQYHCNKYRGNRHVLNQLLIDEFCRNLSITQNHRILARLPIRTFWTTNYDNLIEKALEEAKKVPDVKYTIPHLNTTRPRRDAVVYKMHGDIQHPDQAVLMKDDYERYHTSHGPFITALSGDLVAKTFLFLGFSFNDPNLDFILSRIRISFSTSQRQHFCIFKKRAPLADESTEEFQYAVLKQQLAVNDLERFNIQTLFVNEYTEITDILKRIENCFRQRTVFISGSACIMYPKI